MSEIIQEIKGNSSVRMTRNSKISMLGNRLAVGMARSHKDPLFAKYEQARAKFIQLKQMIEKKYGRQGISQARMSR